MTVNLNLIIGLVAIVAIGVLATQGLLRDDWAQMAAAFLLGGGTVIGSRDIVTRRKQDEDGPVIGDGVD